uniref:Uncharacterized protein n=1 Tax=Anguilla anguilla TaxID=7936 RepID=A0A0E9V0Y5_ANGAN
MIRPLMCCQVAHCLSFLCHPWLLAILVKIIVINSVQSVNYVSVHFLRRCIMDLLY